MTEEDKDKKQPKKIKAKGKKTFSLSDVAARVMPASKMLALEVTDQQLFGALVTGGGKNYAIQDFISVNRRNRGDDLPDPADIKDVMERLDYQRGAAVLISPLARTVQISVNKNKVKKLNDYQLGQSLRWEIEPFTGINGVNALVGMGKAAVTDSDEQAIVIEDEEEEVDISLSAIEKNVYRALKQIFKRAGLRLARLYPPEVCFYMTVLSWDLEVKDKAPQAVLDIGHNYANFVIIKGPVPLQISTLPMGMEVFTDMLAGEETAGVRENLQFLVNQIPAPLPLILTGVGAGNSEIVDFLDRKCANGAVALTVKRQARLTEVDYDRMNSVYATVIGAALRELLGRGHSQIGISDTVPMVSRLKQNTYVVPLAVAVTMLLFLLGHNAMMTVEWEKHQVQIKELGDRLKVKQDRQAAFDQVNQEFNNLRNEISLVERKISFTKGGSDENLIHFERVLAAFARVSEHMTLESVRQNEGGFQLSGAAGSLKEIGSFSLWLQEHDWCRAVIIKNLETGENGSIRFLIEVETKG